MLDSKVDTWIISIKDPIKPNKYISARLINRLDPKFDFQYKDDDTDLLDLLYYGVLIEFIGINSKKEVIPGSIIG